jgi:hypothetical protein
MFHVGDIMVMGRLTVMRVAMLLLWPLERTMPAHSVPTEMFHVGVIMLMGRLTVMRVAMLLL